VGGWSVDLIAGEDPDVGFRLVDAGWRIRRLAVPMTEHDIRITRFSQYWRRAVRSGFAYAAAGWRNRRGSGRMYLIRGVKFTVHAILLSVLLVAATLWWPVLSLAIMMAVWIVWRAGRFAAHSGLGLWDSARYSLLAIPVRFAQGLGFLRAALQMIRGGRPQLIEYKPAPSENIVACR